jgi:hypothetical protein
MSGIGRRGTASRVNWLISLAYGVGVIKKSVGNLAHVSLAHEAFLLTCALIIEEILYDQ